MLVLSMRPGDYIMIGDNIRLDYVERRDGDKIRVGFTAPREVKILRGEVVERDNATANAKRSNTPAVSRDGRN